MCSGSRCFHRAENLIPQIFRNVTADGMRLPAFREECQTCVKHDSEISVARVMFVNPLSHS